MALPVPVYPRLLVKGRGRVLGAEQPPLDEGPTVINGDYRGQSTIKVRLAISQLPREPTFRSLGYAALIWDYAVLRRPWSSSPRATCGRPWCPCPSSVDPLTIPRQERHSAGSSSTGASTRSPFAIVPRCVYEIGSCQPQPPPSREGRCQGHGQ